MIPAELLRKLGWSSELIDAVERVAGPLRSNELASAEVGASSVQTTSSSLYGEAIVQNTAQRFMFSVSPNEQEKT